MVRPHKASFSLLDFAKRLIDEAVAWSNDELELTKQDAKALVRRYVIALGLVFAAFAVLTAAIFTLAQTLIGALAVYLYGHVVAGLVVSLIMFGLTIGLLLIARYTATRKTTPKGVVFLRLQGRASKR